MVEITVSDDCTACGFCAEVCPSLVFAEDAEANKFLPKAANRCIACGHCAAVCPVDAITVEGIEFSKLADDLKAQIADAPFPDWLKTRRSIRKYSEKPVSRQEIERVLSLAAFAPDAHNLRRTRFVVVNSKNQLAELEIEVQKNIETLFKSLRDKDKKAELQSRFGEKAVRIWRKLLPELRFVLSDAWREKIKFLLGAPAIVAAIAPDDELYAVSSAELACYQAMLVAHYYNLGSCWLGFFMIASAFSEKIASMLSLENNETVAGAFALGYPKYEYRKNIVRKLPINFI